MSKCYLLFAEGLEECEGLITLDILRRAGLETYTVSIQEAHTVVGAHGVPITCDRTLPELLAALPETMASLERRLEGFCAACPDGVRQTAEHMLDSLPRRAAELAGQVSSAVLQGAGRAMAALPRVLLACGTTVLAVFENIMASCMDNFGWSRKKATIVCGIFILLASMPCVLGYNLWYFEASLPSGATGQILDIEDFLVSNLLLPIGSLIYLLFCVSKWGWGFDKYLAEANKGTGLGMSPRFKIYFQFILPMLILVILLVGLGSWGWRALICAAVAVFVWFMARRSSSKSTI